MGTICGGHGAPIGDRDVEMAAEPALSQATSAKGSEEIAGRGKLRGSSASLQIVGALALVLILGHLVPALAQPNPGGGGAGGDGGDIFAKAAKTIVGEIATGAFGAMATVVTGALAIVAAITGSYRGAWAILFVSIGLFILEPLCKLLFPSTFG